MKKAIINNIESDPDVVIMMEKKIIQYKNECNPAKN